MFSRWLERIRTESVVYHHDSHVPNVEIPDSEATVEWISSELTDRTIEQGKRATRFHYFLDNGYSGLLAHENNSWIAYGWIYRPRSAAVPLHLPDWIDKLDIYWLIFARTKEQYRGKGWHKYLLAERLQSIYESNPAASIYTDTGVDNVSRFSMTSVGFEPAGKVVTYSLGYPPFDVKQFGRWDWESTHPPLPDGQ